MSPGHGGVQPASISSSVEWSSIRAVRLLTLDSGSSSRSRPLLAVSQAAELTLANAIDKHRKLLKVTVDLRNLRARELIQNALSRNRDALRQSRRSMALRQSSSQEMTGRI